MPYPNEHSCRIRDPDAFQQDSFRRIERGSGDNKISIIIGRPKGESTTTTQAYRYDKELWTEARAKSHCEDAEGTFEPASKQGGSGKFKDEDKSLTDYEYLLHHIEIDNNGDEIIHHCLIYDHIGNMFEQAHLWIDDGKLFLDGKEIKEGYFHIIDGLEPTQEIAWSDAEAKENGIKPKAMIAGMSLKEKARIW